MKKLLTGMLAIAMLLSCICIFSACSVPKPELDLEEAVEALEDEDYDVYYEDEEDGSLDFAMEERVVALQDAGDYLIIIKFKSAASAKLYYKQVKELDEFEQEVEKSSLEVMEHFLKTYEDNLSSDEIDELEDEIKSCKKSLKDEDYVVGRSGVYVWYGTKDAIEDSKG